MSFLHPWAIWIGAVAAAGPLVIHLFTRPRPVRMPLSTLRFVREAIRQRRARHRLRDWVILALRTAAILLLAFTVARPQWGQQPLVSDRQAGRAVRVVILDTSQSMAATERGIEAMERARTVAARFLRYRPGLRANLILAGARAQAVFDQPSANFDALRDAVAGCRAVPERADVNRALGSAAVMLAPVAESDRRRRELVVVSDFQRANWAAADFSQLPSGTQIQLESVARPSPPGNLAILRVEGRPAGPHGGSMRLEVEVGNFSATARKVSLQVALGDSTRRLKATCPAGRSTTVVDQIELGGPSWQSGRVGLVDVDDALAADNCRPLVMRIRPKPVYALLTRQPADRRPSSSHFLECALVPDAGVAEEASAELLRIDPSDLEAPALASADLIVLEHPGKLSGESVKLLADLLRRGRPILYVASETIDAVNLKQLSDAAATGLQMPVEFMPAPGGQIRRDLRLASVAADRRPFSTFGDQLPAILRPLRFAGGLSSRRKQGTLDDDLLASYSDGSACLVLSASDAGALAVLNADLALSNLPKTPAIVPLLDELVGQLLDRNRARVSAPCGEPLVVHLPAEAGSAAGLRIAGPEGAEAAVSGDSFGQLTDGDVGVTWYWPAPDRPGAYQVQRDQETVFSLAVAIPAEESHLDRLPPEVLQGRLAGGYPSYYHSATGTGDRRQDGWQWFAVACVVCMLGELAALLAFRT